MANYPVVSPSKRADRMCIENTFPPWDSAICHMPLTRDCRRMSQAMRKEYAILHINLECASRHFELPGAYVRLTHEIFILEPFEDNRHMGVPATCNAKCAAALKGLMENILVNR
ncbi:hypothetical protein AVEN_261716-1 [Araneus ventricosus]|uniref:Uncharacterized protein n=1 Tax=Araneus ventricosus TaxID=182803 RepID=A0A4Y2DX66_ARAVE|nr:hypothetical protein AVEN_261716-1 [Araneus ventricosus]